MIIHKKRNINSVYPVSCPLCGNRNLKLISKRGQLGLPCYVSICPQDGLVFLSPRWSREKYSNFYAKKYDSLYRPNVLECETDNKYKRVERICYRLEQYNLIRNRTSVLDVGAGMGWALEYLKLKYPNFKYFAAIEQSKHCIKNLEEKINAEIVARDIDSEWQKHIVIKFDFIIMRHVLEHILNPIEAMNQISKSLSDNGVAYIAVPNMMNPKGSLYRYWFRAVHIFYFSESTLMEMACRAGLRPICIQEEGSELWAVFQKLNAESSSVAAKNVYHTQLAVIRNYKFKTFFSEAKYWAGQIIINILSLVFPAKFIYRLKTIYRNYNQ